MSVTVQNPHEVVEQLQIIIARAIAERNPIGYFAALYKNVTLAVIEGIANGFFEDGPRMALLDTLFADRYLTAYAQYRGGELPTRAWYQALTATESSQPIVLQYLLVGINAHINLDLGIAAARTSPGAALAGLEEDFNRINRILYGLIPLVEERLIALSPKLGELVSDLPFRGKLLLGFSMTKARDSAWRLASRLAPKPLVAQLPDIEKRDKETKLYGDAILWDNSLIKAVKAQESDDVAHNIRVLENLAIALPSD